VSTPLSKTEFKMEVESYFNIVHDFAFVKLQENRCGAETIAPH
jgi:hypothetical protein